MSPASSAEELVGEARRLRFRDAEIERRFNDERVEASRMRQRVMSAVAMVATAAMGWNEANLSAPRAPEYVALALHHRFYVVVPAWLVIFGLTFLRPNRGRMEWVNVAMTVGVCWGLGLMSWHHSWLFAGTAWSQNLAINLMAVLLVSAFGLPFRFKHLVVTVGASLGGTLLFCALTLPESQSYDLNVVATGYIGIGLCTLVMGWWRESGERAMFAQREQARRLAGELEVSNAALARLSAEQAEFITIAAHDLRSPLAIVRGYAEMLTAGMAGDAAQQRGALQEIQRQSTRMLGLVNDYLGAHAAEGRGAEVRWESVELAGVLRDAATRHAPLAGKKQQRIEGEPVPAEARVKADAAMLAQVLDNFLSNAIKYSPMGARIRLAVERLGPAWRVAVADEGPGVAPEERAQMFRKYGRSRARPTAGEASHGLGLAVTARLAKAMGGEVGCEQGQARGAMFWVVLPEAEC